MKCSDCKLWETDDCRNNPEAKDLNYAETFACFDLKEGYVPPADVQVDDVDDMDYEEQALKERNRALAALIIGLVLIPITPPLVFAAYMFGFDPDSSTATFVAFFSIAGIVGLSCLVLLLAALVFFLRYVDLKGHIKNPKRK